MEVSFVFLCFFLSLFFLPLYANVSHTEPPPPPHPTPPLPPGCISSWYSILRLHRLCTQKIDCTNFRKSDTPAVYTSSSQLQCFLSPLVRTNLQTRHPRPKRLVYYKLQLVILFFQWKKEITRPRRCELLQTHTTRCLNIFSMWQTKI